MHIKCTCTKCAQPIEFPNEMIGHAIECPNCNMETILFEPSPPTPIPKPKVPTSVVADAKKSSEKLELEKSEQITDALNVIGRVFLTLGVIGFVICGICILTVNASDNNYEGDKTTATVSLICIGVLSIAQGFVIKTIFQALAEIIRLLRKLTSKT